MQNTREYIVLHHTAIATQGPQFDQVNRSHKARGFPKSSLGFYVGYHYFVGFDGTIKVARLETEIGAHCDVHDMNRKGIGICLAGDFTKSPPNPQQIKSLAILMKDVKSRNSIADDHVHLHREEKQTSCPGVDIRKLAFDQMHAVTAEDLQFRLEEYETEYKKATTIPEQNRLRRIIERIEQALALLK